MQANQLERHQYTKQGNVPAHRRMQSEVAACASERGVGVTGPEPRFQQRLDVTVMIVLADRWEVLAIFPVFLERAAPPSTHCSAAQCSASLARLVPQVSMSCCPP